MQAMSRALPSSLLASFACAGLAVACGGSEPTPQAPPAAPPPAAAAAPAPAAAATPTPATDEAWEGEAEAKGEKAGAGAGGAETRTTEVIAKMIKDNRKAFRDCYEKGTKDLPDVEGTLTLHFVLDPTGKVKVAELNTSRSTIKAPSVVDCAIAALKAMQFPPSSRGMESVINSPFDFKR
jgi:hypothetical protein